MVGEQQSIATSVVSILKKTTTSSLNKRQDHEGWKETQHHQFLSLETLHSPTIFQRMQDDD